MAGEKILIVDDEAGMRKLLGRVLAKNGYESVAAADGKEALRLVEGEQFDLVITDIKMPGMDGLQLMQELKEFNPVYDVRVSVLGHQQRGGSPTAFDRILASRLVSRATMELIDGNSGIMVGVKGNETVTSPLSVSWEGGSSDLPEELLRLYKLLAT